MIMSRKTRAKGRKSKNEMRGRTELARGRAIKIETRGRMTQDREGRSGDGCSSGEEQKRKTQP